MILLVVLTVPMMIQVSQIAPAAAADDMPVYLKVYAEPNPVGVGQVSIHQPILHKTNPNRRRSRRSKLYTGLSRKPR